MNYWGLNAIFLAAVVVVVVVVVVRGKAPRTGAIALSAGALLVLTAVFDNIMIGVGLVGYADYRISGVLLGIAPIEDFAYAIAAAVLAPSLWMLFARGRQDADD